MRTSIFFRAFTALTVIAISLFSFVSAASAARARGYTGIWTILTMEPPTSVSVGNPSTVVMHLALFKGEPVANQRVELFVDGVHERIEKTDASGNVSMRVRRDVAGTYKLEAIFKGARHPALGYSKATADLVVTPEIIEIHTTPSLPNIKFSFDNQVFSSDNYGVARISVKKAGTYHLELLPVETKSSNIQMSFDRWGDEIFKPFRDITVPLNMPLEIGFEVSYQVSQTFVDLQSRPVDPSRVTSVTLKGSNGTTYTFEDNKPHWLPAGRVIRLNNGLEQTKILYSVISVVVDGSNVVSQAQQRFYVNPDDLWTVKLLLYKAHFTARDALFGFPIGSGIRMEYPDGEVKSYSFNPDKGYAIDGLARGIYRVTVIGAKGYAPATPIALSRDQDVELMVFSYTDLGVFLALGLLLSLGLLLFGRPYLLAPAVALGQRIAPRLQPVVQSRFFNTLTASVSRLLPRGKTAKLEEQDNEPAQLPASEEITASTLSQQAQSEESAPPEEIRDAAQDLLIEDENDTKKERNEPSPQRNEVESPA